jgi:hypothetical protein
MKRVFFYSVLRLSDDQFSIHYCANHSLLVLTFWLVVLMCGIFALGTVIQFLQDVVP